MFKLRPALVLVCGGFGLLAAWPASAQPVYYNTSSATVSLNTLDSVGTNGSGNATLLTATGVDLNHINRCTSVAVDALNGKLFLVDGLANAIFSANINGTSPTLLKSGLTNFPTDLALDVLNQKIYFTTSSTITANNTVQRMDYTGSNNVILLSAGGTSLARCTALAVDLRNAKIFVADAGAQKIWSLSLTGTGLTPLAATTNCFPSGVAVDPTNQLVYFTASSTAQGSNLVQRVNYNGSGLTTRFTASGGVQRCTALDLDLAHGIIYLSDAGTNALWRMPLASGAPTAVLNNLPATAKKVRWFNGPNTRPPPGLTGIHLAGTNVVLNATNGFVGGTYYVLTTTNLAAPLNQWLPVFTNVLGASGSFTLTASNTFASKNPRQFYILRVQ